MSSAHSSRHNNAVKQKAGVPNRKKSAQKEQKMTDTEESAGKLFTITIDANTAQIVRLESQDATGSRHELSDEEKASLAQEAQEGGEDRLEDVLEQAFEAGIACVLGGAAGQDKAQESAEDAELRHLLLTPLIEHSPARHLLRPDVLNRAILATLIEHSTKPLTAAPEGGQAPGDRAESARAH
jgi:hypothetical protein